MADTEEADKHCGKYLCRTGNVANLCRFCMCPTQKSDDPRREDDLKNWKNIRQLLKKKDHDALQAMSQKHLDDNAWYRMRFGQLTDG